MATKAMNIKLEENKIYEVKKVASIFNLTITDVIREALDEYLAKMKKDPFYRLSANVEEASMEESAEILDELNALSDEDLQIHSVKTFSV